MPVNRISNWVQVNLVERLLIRRSAEKMYLVLGGHIFFETLSAAVEFDLFGLLDKEGKLTREQIAQRLQLAAQPVRILLLGCVTLGLVRKSGSYYSNTFLSKQLLVRGSKKNIIDVVRWQHHINYQAMHCFEEAIRANANVGLRVFAGTEPTLYERLAHNPELETIFQDAMRSISVQANEMLAKNLDLSRTGHLVDVGGGAAANIMTLARKYPQLRATVFDSPTVCEIAKKRIQDAGMSDRLGAVPGNCFNDPFPADADCILFAHFFTIWSESRNRQLLRKCYDSLPSGGSVIIFNMMQRNSEDGPHSAAMGSPYFLTLATGEGMLYTWDEYIQWMRDAGFASVTRQVLPRDHGLIIGRKD
jgi:ubiquinone/menaquinone biosynthesis C-methylase UbiE